jgi:site-specific DNA-methyltransferase (adenine-specific)
MADNSVDAVVTDPPYYKVKGEAWDHQWDSPAGFLSWVGDLCAEWHRILAPNGSLYVFASPKMAARVECVIGERFNVLNRITWRKHDGTDNEGGLWSRADKDVLRRFFEQKEEIIFAEHYGADNIAKGESGYGAKCDALRGFVFEPLRAYLDGERERAGIDFEQVRQVVGCAPGSGLPSHWFTRSQWALPTEANYLKLREGFHRLNHGGDYLQREYEGLQREYEGLQREYEGLRREYEGLRRPFSVSADVPYTDVWTFPTVAHYPGKHPCEKPIAMIEHIIKASSRPGDVVADFFLGSGTTALACLNTGRRFVGCDNSAHWVEYAERRIAEAQRQPALMEAAR